jgi:methyltransferase (TIGR00027 family)
MTRTDSDTWDLASSVGATATAVAAGRAMASQGPDAPLDDPWADPLVRAVGVPQFISMIDGDLLTDNDPLMSRQTMVEQMVVRTRFFDDFLIDSGLTQAVILASGLDTRAYRLAWPAGTTVFEVDQPEVIDFKSRTLAELGATPSADRRAVGIDLRDDWPTALTSAGFDPSRPTAWIAEGLLIYLPPQAQDALFDRISALSAPGSRLATEHMDMDSLPADWAQKIDERSQQTGSDIRLSELFYQGQRNSAGSYLQGLGWQTHTLRATEAFAANGFQLPTDELSAFLGGDSGYLTAVLE